MRDKCRFGMTRFQSTENVQIKLKITMKIQLQLRKGLQMWNVGLDVEQGEKGLKGNSLLLHTFSIHLTHWCCYLF